MEYSLQIVIDFNVKISPGAVVCDESEIIGDVTIGTRTVIHPKAKIIAEDGPIIIGENNIIEELACIINKAPATASPGSRQVMLTSGCIIGAACTVTSSEDLDENCVIYGANCERRMQKEHPPAQTLQIDFLTKILPNYHYLKKPTKSSTPQRN
ncbi:DCTN6-like protein [Mya arenaria]|uniref:Dynactin subunit 6 n=1 Tax=Mya arenaria TaxID=6604 RepID=A0ABY7FSK7_MYAAR|nr:DCTN6-like protein [Mya arenaria]